MADLVISQTDDCLKSVAVKILSGCDSENLVCLKEKES